MAYPWIETPGQPLQDDPLWEEVPPLDAPPEGSGYREAENSADCGECLHQLGGICHLWRAKVSDGNVCHDWAPDLIDAGGIIDEEVERPIEVGMAEMLFSESSDAQCFEDEGGLVWKAALRTGEWAMSPGPNAKPVARPLRVRLRTEEPTKEIGLENLVEAFRDRAMDHVTVPLSHADRVDENTGFVQDLKVVPDPQREGEHVLMAGYRFTEPDIKDKVKRGTIANNSVGVLFNYFRKRDGKKFPQALGHIALTNKPWIDGLTPFGVNASEGYVESGEAVFCAEINVKPYMRGGRLVKGYVRDIDVNIDQGDFNLLRELRAKVSSNKGVFIDEFDGATGKRAAKDIDRRLGRMYVEGLVHFRFSGSRGTEWGLTAKGREVVDNMPDDAPLPDSPSRAMAKKAVSATDSYGIADTLADAYGFVRVNNDRDRSNGEDVFDGGELGRVYVKHGSGMDAVIGKGQLVGVTAESPDGEIVYDWADHLHESSSGVLDDTSNTNFRGVMNEAFMSLRRRWSINPDQEALFAEVEEYLALGNSGPLPGDKPGKDDNWVDKAGGLPPYVREVARELMKNGHTKSRAIATAISRIKMWAATSKDPKVKAKAAKAIAQWEAMKVRSKASSAAKAGSNLDERGKEVNLPDNITPDELEIQLAEARKELAVLRKEKHEREVDARIDELSKKWADAPALLSEVRALMMADDGEPVVSVMLSETEGTEPVETGLSVTKVVERLLAAIPDLGANLSEQHNKIDGDRRPADAEKTPTVEERAKGIAAYLGDDDYLKTLQTAQS